MRCTGVLLLDRRPGRRHNQRRASKWRISDSSFRSCIFWLQETTHPKHLGTNFVMALNVGYAIGRNRHWGSVLSWLRHSDDICIQVLDCGVVEGTSSEFAHAVYDWQEDQVRLTADGVIGPKTWRMLKRMLRGTAVPVLAAPEPDQGARACLNAFIFCPLQNSYGYPADATGMFHPASENFRRLHRTSAVFRFDNGDPAEQATLAARNRARAGSRQQVFDALNNAPNNLDTIAYFGHGLSHAMLTAGIYTRHISEFANLIRAKAAQRCKILLYACSCGAPGGFAEALAGELNGHRSQIDTQFEVYGHSVPGRAHINPTKRVYPEARFIVEPGTRLFSRWRVALNKDSLWARYAYMREEDVRAAIG